MHANGGAKGMVGARLVDCGGESFSRLALTFMLFATKTSLTRLTIMIFSTKTPIRLLKRRIVESNSVRVIL